MHYSMFMASVAPSYHVPVVAVMKKSTHTQRMERNRALGPFQDLNGYQGILSHTQPYRPYSGLKIMDLISTGNILKDFQAKKERGG